MPAVQKLVHFLSSAFLSAAGVAILGYGMSTDWAKSTLDCSATTSDIFNGSSALEIGLFNGTEVKISCPRFDTLGIPVEVFKRLAKMGGAPIALHGLVVALLAFALLGSAGSILVTLYNSFSNPYETYMGPIGLYTCSGFSACAAFLALILYVLNVFAVQMFQKLVLADNDQVKLSHNKTELQVGFFLLIPYIATKLLAILVVYLYAHAAFTRRKQQDKPTEDAPKDIMLF
ncbi:clarin-3 [Triplophysa rosa]|uniref:Clarin-3 n=1 Tax=Triplophysa rosa TaxID=992332 RepID=A0A9W7TI72_TRIRA|nr:clarin-3 [Triplophysa rosa]KAI7796898.1 putative clarin-3 [Triplophysa rosa]